MKSFIQWMESEKPGTIVGYEAVKPNTGEVKKFTVDEKNQCRNYANLMNKKHGSAIWLSRPIIKRD